MPRSDFVQQPDDASPKSCHHLCCRKGAALSGAAYLSSLCISERKLDQLQEMEISLHQFEVRTNVNMLRKLLHPDFIEIGYSGSTYNYEAIVSELSQETRPDYTVWSQDFKCHDLVQGAKLLIYKSAHIYPDGSLSRHAKRASVWVNISDSWQIKYHHATPIAGFMANA